MVIRRSPLLLQCNRLGGPLVNPLEAFVAHVSLYRKYRPNSFADVVGQDHVTETLARAVDTQSWHHAYLFTGPRGTGKTSSARLLAMGLNASPGPTSTPDPNDPIVVAIREGSCPDVIEIDAASNSGVDDVRDLRDKINYSPTQGRLRIYIVDECHMLSNSAWNAFLKTIEEPPGHVVFIFATTEPHKVLPTVLSRTQRFDFRRVSDQVLTDHCLNICAAEGVQITTEALAPIVRAGDGSVRDTLSVLDQVIAFTGNTIDTEAVNRVLGTVPGDLLDGLVNAIARADVADAFALVGQVADQGIDLRQFALDAQNHLRELLILSAAPNAGLIEGTPERLSALQTQAASTDTDRLLFAVERLNDAQVRMRAGNTRLPLEVALAKAVLNGADRAKDVPRVMPSPQVKQPSSPKVAPATPSMPAKPTPTAPASASPVTPASSTPPRDLDPEPTPQRAPQPTEVQRPVVDTPPVVDTEPAVTPPVVEEPPAPSTHEPADEPESSRSPEQNDADESAQRGAQSDPEPAAAHDDLPGLGVEPAYEDEEEEAPIYQGESIFDALDEPMPASQTTGHVQAEPAGEPNTAGPSLFDLDPEPGPLAQVSPTPEPAHISEPAPALAPEPVPESEPVPEQALTPEPTPEPDPEPAPVSAPEPEQDPAPKPAPTPTKTPQSSKPTSQGTAGADTTFTLDQVQGVWERVLGLIMGESKRIGSIYSQGAPIRVSANVITIGYRFAYHADMASEPDAKAIASRHFSTILGAKVNVESQTNDQAEPIEAPVEAEEPVEEVETIIEEPDVQVDPEQLFRDAVSLVKEELGAKDFE